MSERLELSGIRDAAMQPPVGGAAGYEQMLLGQFQQAAQDEENLRREAVRAATQRALDRSGWYNVGQMLIPQDAGEAVLGLAMGPGLGRGLRTALAALGGLTTQPGDAEGAFLPRFMVQRLLGSGNREARMAGQEGMDALADAARTPGGRAWTGAPGDIGRNALFEDALYDTSSRNVLPTEAGFAWALPPERQQEFFRLFDAGNDVNRNGVLRRFRRSDLVHDPLLEAALPASSRMNAGTVAIGPRQGNTLGSYNPESGLVRVNAGTPASMRDTFSHEMQHWIQAETPGRYARGTSPEGVAQANVPMLWDEYLQRALAPDVEPPSWTQVPGGVTYGDPVRDASRAMYERNFGEWEARLAGLHDRYGAGAPEGINSLGYTLDEFMPNNPWPDFRIR